MIFVAPPGTRPERQEGITERAVTSARWEN